jgi:branched-chain amino acid transport system substrate-binding protein
VRIAFIDPLSGPAADIGRNSLRSWQFMAEQLAGPDNPAGVRFVVAGFDNKGSPKKSLDALKAAIDQGFRYVVQGNGSGVAAAISDAVTRHNTRHPEQAVLYINYAAMDPALTSEKCSFWHFRIDADTTMKTRALALFMATQPELKSVYLLNQNYAHGQQFSRYFREALAQERPDIQIAGDELHLPFAGLDFTTHVRRMAESGAQAVVTGNWGADLRGVVKAMQQQGVTLPLYAYYPMLKGVPELLASGDGRLPVYQVANNHTNQAGNIAALATAFRRRYDEDLVVYAAFDGMSMLLQAMTHAQTTDAARVAARLSGMVFPGFNGPVHLRADDHQLLQGLYVSRWQKVDEQHPRAAEATGYTFVPVRYLSASEISGPTLCRMQRP